MLKFVDTYIPNGFVKSEQSTKTPRVRFDALSVGVHLALQRNPSLVISNLDWLDTKAFNELITKGGQNSPTAIKNRIEYVVENLLK